MTVCSAGPGASQAWRRSSRLRPGLSGDSRWYAVRRWNEFLDAFYAFNAIDACYACYACYTCHAGNVNSSSYANSTGSN